MGLFDAFDSSENIQIASNAENEEKQLNKKARQEYKDYGRQAYGALRDANIAGSGYLQDFLNRALGTYGGGLAQQRADLTGGMYSGLGVLSDAENRGRGDILGHMYGGLGVLSDAENRGRGDLDQALGLYGPLMQQANRGAELYGNFFGLGGQQGFDQAQSDWNASPLYRAMAGEGSLGVQAINRQATARGNPYAAHDLQAYDDALAGKYLGQYISGLAPYLNQQQQVANAQAGLYGQKANLTGQLGGQAANLTQNAGNNLANLTGQLGGQAANIAYNTGSNLSNAQQAATQNMATAQLGTGSDLAKLAQDTAKTQAVGVLMPTAQGIADTYMDSGDASAAFGANAAAANNTANTNTWNAILGAAGIGGNILGSWLGGGG